MSWTMLQHLGLAVAGEVLVDVDLAEGLADVRRRRRWSSASSGALLGLAAQDAAVEVEVLVVEGRGAGCAATVVRSW